MLEIAPKSIPTQIATAPPQNLQTDFLPFVIGNSPPTANLSVAGTKEVGHTVALKAAAHNNDPGALNYNWSIATHPLNSVANLSNPHAAAPTIALASKHDIGDWTVHLDLAVAQGELKTLSVKFNVPNQAPELNFTGPTTT